LRLEVDDGQLGHGTTNGNIQPPEPEVHFGVLDAQHQAARDFIALDDPAVPGAWSTRRASADRDRFAGTDVHVRWLSRALYVVPGTQLDCLPSPQV